MGDSQGLASAGWVERRVEWQTVGGKRERGGKVGETRWEDVGGMESWTIRFAVNRSGSIEGRAGTSIVGGNALPGNRGERGGKRAGTVFGGQTGGFVYHLTRFTIRFRC